MKRKWLLLTLMVVALLAFTACKDDDETTTGGTTGTNTGTTDTGSTDTGSTDTGSDTGETGEEPAEEVVLTREEVEALAGGKTIINVMSFTDEVPNMINRYLELNPAFGDRYYINTRIVATDANYQGALDTALTTGGANAPHIYTAEVAFVLKYTQGDMKSYAATYESLGITDIQQKISDAQIAQYTVDLGTRDGQLVGLGFQATGSAVIYRRSIAEEVLGTQDPDAVGRAIAGPGLDNFMSVAAQMNEAGYSMVSGTGDLWQGVRNTGAPWVVNDTLQIAPERMAMFDIAHTIHNEGYSNGANAWSDGWFADMGGNGDRPVFCFLGPAWLINYVMAGNAGETSGDWGICVSPIGFSWGGTWVIAGNNATEDAAVRDGVRELVEWITLDTSDTGLQYHWANGTLFGPGGTKDTGSSATVMARSDGTLDYLAGQNMFDIMVPAGANADGTIFTQYDEVINEYFLDAAMNYARGQMDREAALEAFKDRVFNTLGIDVG